mgnify:CR=1 FL=1
MSAVDSITRFTGKLTAWKAILMVVLAFGLYATVIRFAQGLGAATNLSDEFPWGIWIGFDMLVGVGVAAGGFVIAATVHVFHLKKYESIARPTILTAFLGYLLVIVALLFDLGQPWRIWHTLILWNPHSVMFEVGWCVMLYTTVLAIEFSPFVFERFGWQFPLRIVRMIYVPLVIVGVLLSTMHQSSLGTLYIIAATKLHPLWYSPILPIFFFLSAVAAGLAMVVFESFLSARAFGKQLEADLLRGVGRVTVVVLAAYSVWRFEDLALRDNLGYAFQPTPEAVMFWGEMGLGALLPMTLLAFKRVRHSEQGLLFGSLLAILGFIVNRLNVAITGMTASSGVTYVPSWMEFAVTMMLVGIGFTVFALAVRYLPIFPEAAPASVEAPAPVRARFSRPAAGRTVLAGLWVLLAFGAVAVGYAASRNGHVEPAPEPPAAEPFALPDGARLPDDYVFPAGDDSPGEVVFRHGTHVEALGSSCASCHQATFRLNEPGTPISGTITFERIHEGDLCGSCHDGERAFAVDDDCTWCHAG